MTIEPMNRRFPYPKTHDACRQVCEHLTKALDLKLATVWSLDPVSRQLILVAWSGSDLSNEKRLMPSDGYFSGLTADRRQIRMFADISQQLHGREFFHPNTMRTLGLKQMISVPILNRSNPHQLLFVLNLFPKKDLSKNDPYLTQFLEVERPSEYLELCLRQECMRAAHRIDLTVNTRGGRASLRTMCLLFSRSVSEKVPCDTVAVFIEREDDNKPEMLGTDGYRAPIMADVAAFEQIAKKCWTANRESLFSRRIQGLTSFDIQGASVPLRDAFGTPRGSVVVIDAGGNSSSRQPTPYSYEHIAVLEAMGSAFAARLEILLSHRRQSNAMARLTHEMRVPITAFRAGIAEIRSNLNHKGLRLDHDYLGDLETYAETMQRNVRELNLIQKGRVEMELKTQPTYFDADILRPAVRFLEPVLHQRQFDMDKITISLQDKNGRYIIPMLDLDRPLMTQVVFNLLENSIKFADADPERFRITVTGEYNGERERYEVLFRDWGLGVPDGYDTRIFQEGTRGPNAWVHNVVGDGLGLYVAREFMRLHKGGDLEFRRRPDCTEFAVLLPACLRTYE